ncbi:pannexin-2 isoform X1 [Mauremys reevesii]|uniref:pannexin-2 isoform X1 n=2 Tax=Mauremys reevesii TaxID=260615 RepID=UPI00193F7CB6|nr:pannexin-2 isoform X1 [Mauremys reevesii]XP_039368103.1 pannexin-2 isoform X1 [Mauremys reevesii]XP_039368111.1 pannexin-2 isoform X1 [Mauremys reevesii]XP_039368116.1 pannexin-2 isoform X1 [Mauremys reevesii]
MQHIIDNHPDMATALLAGEKLKELILPGQQDDKAGSLAALLLQLKLELPFDRVVTIGTVLIPILLVTLVFTKNFAEEPIYCYTPHNFTRDQALYARGYCWTELIDALPGVDASHWPSLFEHKFLPYALLAFAGIMYIPALGWEFLASTRLTSELNFLLQEIDNCYHRAAEGRAPKIEKQIQSKGPGITEREKREIIENAEKEKSPEQNLFEKYLERRGRSNFLAKLYLARHLFIIFLSIIPITYLSTYYATQKQNEFTCALGEPPDKTSSSKLHIRVNCKLPAVQLQRIIAGVDIVLLCFMNLIILINLVHLFIFRKSNFIFDKLNKVGIKTKKQWQKSQFCDINILAMFCNENRDHIKSLNRLDFITNESDLMYDNVVRQLLAALAQSNHDVTPTMRDSGIQTIDPSVDPADIDASEQLVIKRPRKKMKWIPSSNPLPQPFKEQLAIMKVENHKPEKPKPVRRKTATDSLIAPLIDSTSKTSQQSSSHKTESNTISSTGNEKKHIRHFSLDVHPYILSSKKPKPEIQAIASMPTSKSQEGGFLNQEENVVVHVTSSLKVIPHHEKEIPYSSETCRTAPAAGTYLSCNHNHIATTTAAATNTTPSHVKLEPTAALNRNPTHPLLNVNTLYEDHEEEVSNLTDNSIHSPTDAGEILSIPTPKHIMMATFEEPRAIVSSVEY